MEKVIHDLKAIRAGATALRRACPVLRQIHDRTGDPPLRRYPADFAGLARIIVGQQLSIAAAASIHARLEASLGAITPTRIARAGTTTLSAAGLSAAKVRTLKALAAAVANRKDPLCLDQLSRFSDDEVRATLTRVSGIGPWTADIYIMFCLGRADAWAAGDLALQVGIARAFGLGERIGATETIEIAERWRPWRGVAARLIWADYKTLRQLPLKHVQPKCGAVRREEHAQEADHVQPKRARSGVKNMPKLKKA